MNKQYFNIKKYLDNKGIKYFTSGKNTIKGSVSVQCPFHDDHSHHLCLFDDTWGKCWSCGNISVKKYIKAIENCDYKEVNKILLQYPIEGIEEQEQIVHPDHFQMPKEFSTEFPERFKNYLEKRGFDWRILRTKYRLMTCHNIGKYKFRIIVPIIMDDKTVSFVARDITNKADLKYINCPEELSILPRKDWVFGIDLIPNDTCIICEGVFDAMKIGPGAVSLLTTNFTKSQINKLRKKGIKKVYIMLDNDEAGTKASEKLESYLSWADYVGIIDLPEGVNDPAEMSDKQVRELRIAVF